MWEVRYRNRRTKETIVVRSVPSFNLASTIAKNLPDAVGWQVVVSQTERPTASKFDVWLWLIEEKKWIRLNGPPLSRRGVIQFIARWEYRDAVAVYWPVGVAIPASSVKST